MYVFISNELKLKSNLVDNLDTYSLNQPIGKQSRNNLAILLVKECKDFGEKWRIFFSPFHSHNESALNSRMIRIKDKAIKLCLGKLYH